MFTKSAPLALSATTKQHMALYFMEYVMLKVFFIMDPCPGPKLALDRARLR